MYSHGWFQIAYEQEIETAVTPAEFGERRLVLIREGERLRTFDGVCPHRGAHLGHGGRLENGAIICPFHGCRVGLGNKTQCEFDVEEYHTLNFGGMVFVRLSNAQENGFTEQLQDIGRDHFFVPGFTLDMLCRADWVIENAFDNAHFNPVHRVLNEPEFTKCKTRAGEYAVRGTFNLPKSRWHTDSDETTCLKVDFHASAYSPGIVISLMGGSDPYWVITASTPRPLGGCRVRLSLAVPRKRDGKPPAAEQCAYLLEKSQQGLEQDRAIWENLKDNHVPKYVAMDRSVIGYRKFAMQFI
jgi:3-ketosteroid 9alpha-monooxygenase subunit A